MNKHTWQYRTNEAGERVEFWGWPIHGATKIPVKGASRWKWSDGSLCY